MSGSENLIRSARFRSERETGWRRLEQIVTVTEQRGVRALSFQDARDLAPLYRQAMNSLSAARAISLDRALLEYLEALCCRAYLAVYAPQETLAGLLWRYVSRGAPQAVRRTMLHLAIASLAMGAGGAAGYLLFLEDQTWLNTFVPGALADGRGPASSRAELLEVIYEKPDGLYGQLAAFAGYLFSHNAQVAFLCFSMGVFVCLPTLLLCVYNGLILGAFVALHLDRGVGIDFFAWLSVHGVTELAAILIASAGGLRLGFAILFPGRYSRRDALRREGPDAAKLAILAVVMLFVAAGLEGFARQLVSDLETRIAIGWSVGALWAAYFALSGRGRTSGAPAETG